MAQRVRYIGGPGAGKTQTASDLVSDWVKGPVGSPFLLGFVSLTRSARREASSRVADLCGVPPEVLEKEGWFRTLHSCCYRLLSVAGGELITGSREDNLWLRSAVADDSACVPGYDLDDDAVVQPSAATPGSLVLALWDIARNRLVPFADVWDRASATDRRLPDLPDCLRTVTAYESAKHRAGRLDFCDLLMRFAGRRWSGNHGSPFSEVRPDGTPPRLMAYVHDEMQDCSRLMSLVFGRLAAGCEFLALMGDAWQALFGFCGSDGSVFSGWPVEREHVLPLSYRCRSRLLSFADGIMHRGGYVRRPFRAAHDGGAVCRKGADAALASVRVGEDTLVMARTNEYVRQATLALDAEMVPWRPVKGQGGFNSPARTAGVVALEKLRTGQYIDGEGYRRLLDLMPSRADGVVLFAAGTKKRFKDAEARRWCVTALNSLDLFGATDACKGLIGSGRYRDVLDPASARMAAAAQRHGLAAVGNPKCRVGTVHACKGLQCDHAVVVDRIPYPTGLALGEPGGMREERRVWYVACTRPRHKLTIAETDAESFPDL